MQTVSGTSSVLLTLFPDFLAADQQLATEIEYDLRKFEEHQEATQRAQAVGEAGRDNTVPMEGQTPTV